MRISARRVQQAVAADFDIGLDQMLSSDRSRPIAQARQVAYYLSREVTPLSYPVLARLFRRDHTTLLSGIGAVKARIQNDRTLALKIEARKLLLQCEPQKVVDATSLTNLGFFSEKSHDHQQAIHSYAANAEVGDFVSEAA